MSAIPKVAHFIWLQGVENLPERFERFHQDFVALHPDWAVEWWDEERIRDEHLPLMDHFDNATNIVPADGVRQLQSDIARYGVLHRHGGAYFDVDMAWLRSITPIIEHVPHDLITSYELEHETPSKRFVATGFIAATAGHPALAEMLEEIDRRIPTMAKRAGANRISGPHPWTPIATREAVILSQEAFHPLRFNETLDDAEATTAHFPRSYGVHAWFHQETLRKQREGVMA